MSIFVFKSKFGRWILSTDESTPQSIVRVNWTDLTCTAGLMINSNLQAFYSLLEKFDTSGIVFNYPKYFWNNDCVGHKGSELALTRSSLSENWTYSDSEFLVDRSQACKILLSRQELRLANKNSQKDTSFLCKTVIKHIIRKKGA